MKGFRNRIYMWEHIAFRQFWRGWTNTYVELRRGDCLPKNWCFLEIQFVYENIQLWKKKIHWLGLSINTTVLEPPTSFSCMVRLSSLGQFREVTSSTTSISGPPTSSCNMIRCPSGSKLLLKYLKLDDVVPDQKLNHEQQAHELNAAHLISCWTLSTFNLTATSPSGLQQSSSIMDYALHVLKHW